MAITAKKVFGALNKKIDTVDKKLDDAIVGIYTPGGSYAFDELPALSADTLGKVYVVTDDFTTTSDFVEGAGVDYPAGTNVAVVNRGTDANPVYKYDATTGAILVDPVPTADSPNAVSSGGTYTALAGKADKVTSPTADNLASLDASGNLADSGISKEVLSTDTTTTAAGNPITFATKSAQKAKGFELLATAEQDLHGYDKPWPGGAYKNKLPILSGTDSAQNVTVVRHDDGSVDVNGTPDAAVYGFTLVESYKLKADSYKINGSNNGGALLVLYDTNDQYLSESGNGADGSFTLTEDTNIRLRVFVYSEHGLYDETLYPMIRLATESDATFAPYENKCPIVGFSEKNVEVSGKNWFDGDWQYGLIDTTTGEVSPNEYVKYHDYIRVKPSTWYTMSAYNMQDLVNPFDIFGYDKNKQYVGVVPINIVSNTTALFAEKFQIPSNVVFIRMHIASTTLGTSDKQQLEVGETYTTYEPYTATDYTISFGQTVYGVKVTEQGCEVTDGIVSLKDLPWIYLSSDQRFISVISGAASVNPQSIADVQCEIFKTVSWTEYASANYDCICMADIGGDSYVGLKCFSCDSVEDLLVVLDNYKITYPLNTPIPLPISPVTLALLAGTNVITTDGDSIKVTYRDGVVATLDDVATLETEVDTKADEAYLAKVESGATASRAYSVNEFMLRADGFYKVTQPIAQNASITASNTEKTTIGAVLTALLNA